MKVFQKSPVIADFIHNLFFYNLQRRSQVRPGMTTTLLGYSHDTGLIFGIIKCIYKTSKLIWDDIQ